MPELILAHDLGTTADKASLFGADGQLLASASCSYPTYYPRAGWAEQSADDWWAAVCAANQQLFSQSPYRAEDVAVVGFSGQMMSCLLVDGSARPLHQSIIWADQRAADEAAAAEVQLGTKYLYGITGHRFGANYTAAKLLWLRKHQPELLQRARYVLQAKDYIAARLTGVFATDTSDASGTNLYDLTAGGWSQALLQALELDAALLPDLHAATDVIGQVSRSAAQESGLRTGTPVVIGGGDGACATAGAGLAAPGDIYLYIGSSSWIASLATQPLFDQARRTFTFSYLDPQLYLPTGTMQCAGGSYDWLERLLRGEGSTPPYRKLDALAEGVAPGARGLLYLPYLLGERSPHWSTTARGSFVGLSMLHGRAEIARAVLEGVAFNLRAILDAFRAQGTQYESLRIIGGGARSALWRQIVADILQLPLLRPQLSAEATSLGAAMAAGTGAGLLGSLRQAARLVRLSEAEKPNPANSALYDDFYGLFCQAYRTLEPLNTALAAHTDDTIE
ncbi:MAG: xylulokinase [Chloroflexi bacterium]|nr:xylulokinase [Chloroflexota bacterium]